MVRSKHTSATRQCGSKGNEEAITSGNFVCRPGGAKPVRPRVRPPEPVVSLATIPDMGSAMRRRATMWAMGHAAPQLSIFPEAEGPGVPEGNHTPLHRGRPGEEGGVSGGVCAHGTYAEAGPGTGEILCLSTDAFAGPLLVRFLPSPEIDYGGESS